MSSVNTASTPLSPSFLYPRAEGSGLGAVGGERRGDDAQNTRKSSRPLRSADEVHVGEDDDGVIEAEDVQPQQTMSTPQLPPRAVIENHRIDHCPYDHGATSALRVSVVNELTAKLTTRIESL